MALGWFTKEVRSAYVARPEEFANELIYLHPDRSIQRGTKLTVRSDECVLFFREGRYIGRINAGSVLLDTDNIPFLGHLVIDGLTGANHFICELFFVSLKETIFDVPWSALGQYKDRNSANVVSINGKLSYTVRVSDPAKLVIETGGQSANSAEVIQEIFNGRMLSQLRRAVGHRTQRLPVLDVVSNFDAEVISNDVRIAGHDEFLPLGVGISRVFDLALALDDHSLDALRAFGRQEAELAIQAKGMQLATGEGFAEYNLVQGQRAALEGLGKGLGTGNGPLIMSGMNLGANLTTSQRQAPRSAPLARPGSLLASQSAYLMRTDSGDTGPFSGRQVALLAISKGLKLSEMFIRSTDDPPDVSFAAEFEPQIAAEYRRRMPPAAEPTPPGIEQTFVSAFSGAIRGGVLGSSEASMLASLSVALGLEPDATAGEIRVRELARRLNISIQT